MGCEFPEHHGKGGGPGILPMVLLALVILAFAAPVAAAAAALIHALILMAAAVTALSVVTVGGFIAYRLRNPRPPGDRVLPRPPWRDVPTLPRPGRREVPELPRAGGDVHLHLHGVDPADVPAILDGLPTRSPRPIVRASADPAEPRREVRRWPS